MIAKGKPWLGGLESIHSYSRVSVLLLVVLPGLHLAAIALLAEGEVEIVAL